MEIRLEKTRIIFSNYTDIEKKRIESLVSTEENIFIYEDVDKNIIAFPPGMLELVKKTFPNINIDDKSSTYWEYQHIDLIKHDAQPRNQIQIDTINLIINGANKKEKVALILGTGTG